MGGGQGERTPSGIVGKKGEKEDLLDDLVAEIDANSNAKSAKKEKQTQAEKRFVAVGDLNRRGSAETKFKT